MVNSKVLEQIEIVALTPNLLVASDFDGTLAPLVNDPQKAKPHREALVALQSLAKLPQTTAAVVSGRALKDLANLTRHPENIHLVGSHGSEFDPDFFTTMDQSQLSLRDSIIQEAKSITKRYQGFFVEEKPVGVSIHFRNASSDDAAQVLKQMIEGPGARSGAFLRHGKKVIEISIFTTNKGDALNSLRHRFGATAVVFFGDDITDEDAFRTLKGPDVGVKVGQGESCAKFRIKDPEEVAYVLAKLSELRIKWLKGSATHPIENYSMLSDMRTVSLVSPDARISWYCVPRIDSGAIFAELVGGEGAGFFAIEPKNVTDKPKQSYLKNSLALQTKWKNLSVTDYLDCSGARVTQRAGRTDLVRVLQGSGQVRLRFHPRLDFGRVPTKMEVVKDAILIEDFVDPIVLRAPGVKWKIVKEGVHHSAEAVVSLRKNKPVTLELRYGTGSTSASLIPEDRRRQQTNEFWSRWATDLKIPKMKKSVREHVVRSALTLKALCYGPSGAIAAAATTSLPETLGGVRNWDYRFTWLRDGAMSAQALVQLGSLSEAMAFLDWVLEILDRVGDPARLRPMYTVTGSSVMAEAEISSLSGYGGSRPVRIGNAAAHQVQLDVFGPIVDLIWDLCRYGAPLSADHWRLVEAMVQAVSERWQEADHGIWEIRADRRHHTHSKTMCWLTLDRAVKISEKLIGRSQPKWAKLRDQIKKEVIQKAWHPKVKAFTTAYEWSDLDAAALYVGMSGLISPKDPKFKATIIAIEKGLMKNKGVYRYHMDDGLPGVEGAFHICTGWLILSMLMAGRKQAALQLFNEYLKNAGPTNLFCEEVNPKTGLGLGNHPQAYSHLAVVQCALALQQEELI